jgi:hypothetical protein
MLWMVGGVASLLITRKTVSGIVHTDDNGPYSERKLRFSVLGFYEILPPVEKDGEGRVAQFNRRHLIPFSRPPWMPEWLE